MSTLWKEGRIDEAVLAVQDMERRGIVGSAALYYDLARCLCSAGRCQEALLQVFKAPFDQTVQKRSISIVCVIRKFGKFSTFFMGKLDITNSMLRSYSY